MFKEYILDFPQLYILLQKAIIKNRLVIEDYLDIKDGDFILDIGCGPAEVLNFLPSGVEYYGFDMSSKYIERAKMKFTLPNYHFSTDLVSEKSLHDELIGKFDFVFALGVLHHLNDSEVKSLMCIAQKALKPGGYLFTIDPCFVENQHVVAKFLVSHDRGKFVRTDYNYSCLIKNFFPHDYSTFILRNDILRLPYNHFISVNRKKNV